MNHMQEEEFEGFLYEDDDESVESPSCASAVRWCYDDNDQEAACLPPPQTQQESSARAVQRVFQELIQQIPHGKAVYQGPYNASGQKHGQGEMIWWNGDVYQGNFSNDERQGHGTLYFAASSSSTEFASDDGGEYVGEWLQDQMHGSGTRRYPNGNVYSKLGQDLTSGEVISQERSSQF
jgi:hypothetical protein